MGQQEAQCHLCRSSVSSVSSSAKPFAAERQKYSKRRASACPRQNDSISDAEGKPWGKDDGDVPHINVETTSGGTGILEAKDAWDRGGESREALEDAWRREARENGSKVPTLHDVLSRISSQVPKEALPELDPNNPEERRILDLCGSDRYRKLGVTFDKHMEMATELGSYDAVLRATDLIPGSMQTMMEEADAVKATFEAEEAAACPQKGSHPSRHLQQRSCRGRRTQAARSRWSPHPRELACPHLHAPNQCKEGRPRSVTEAG